MIPVKIKRLHPEAEIPAYATDGAAGIDLRAMIERPTWLQAGWTMMVPAGIAIHLADPSYVAMLYPRSGLGAKHGIVLGNGTGIIDADYQGEIMCCLWNRGVIAYEIQPRERIAQLVIMPIVRAQFIEVDEFMPTERGDGGFGHSGRL